MKTMTAEDWNRAFGEWSPMCSTLTVRRRTMTEIAKCSFVNRIAPEPENDRPGFMDAFDEIVTGPVDGVHIERMSDDLYWMVIHKGDERQRIVIGSASGKAKVIGRTELD